MTRAYIVILGTAALLYGGCGGGHPAESSDAGTTDTDAATASDAATHLAGDLAMTPVNAGACTGLPAAGTWESISPYSGTTAVFGQNFGESIIVDPFDPATVWLAVGARGIFKSTNCGAPGSFVHVNTGTHGADLDQGSSVSMLLDPVTPNTLYAISIFGMWGFWKSTNGGVDWEPLLANDTAITDVTHGYYDSISMDPTNPQHIVLGLHYACVSPHTAICEVETKDGGKTGHVVDVQTASTNWEEGAGPWVIDDTTWLYAGELLYLTTDGGTTWKDVTPTGTWAYSGGEVETHMIPRAKDGTYFLASSQGVVSSKDGLTWSRISSFQQRVVGLSLVDGTLYASDEWSSNLWKASESDPTTWTTITPPAGIPDGEGAPFVDYDPVHHVLYTSDFNSGAYRTVLP